MEYQNQKGKEGRFSEKLKLKNKPKFVGVRQRASGKWAAEIKDTSKKIRLWLGTYQTAEEAARAYDEAACLLRGSNTRTNFSTQGYGIATNSPISLKLRNLLHRRAMSNQTQNQSSMISTTFQSAVTSPSPNVNAINQNQQVCDNPYGLDMNMIKNCGMGMTPNTTWQFDYCWPLGDEQRINELAISKDDGFGLNVETQLSELVYATNEDTYEYDVNYPLSHFFCFT